MPHSHNVPAVAWGRATNAETCASHQGVGAEAQQRWKLQLTQGGGCAPPTQIAPDAPPNTRIPLPWSMRVHAAATVAGVYGAARKSGRGRRVQRCAFQGRPRVGSCRQLCLNATSAHPKAPFAAAGVTWCPQLVPRSAPGWQTRRPRAYQCCWLRRPRPTPTRCAPPSSCGRRGRGANRPRTSPRSPPPFPLAGEAPAHARSCNTEAPCSLEGWCVQARRARHAQRPPALSNPTLNSYHNT